MERYHHSKLTSPERQIRLLSILPSTHGRQAEYTLETFILNDRRIPYFYAISYEWGPAHPQYDIVVDGKALSIRSNLKDCLERFASNRDQFIRHVWIDAISIDQTDVMERNAQVKMMGEIFHAAKLVMVWLGGQVANGGLLTNAADCLQEWQNSEEFSAIVHNASRSRSPRAYNPPALLRLEEPFGSMWSCLRLLCECGYWKRRWVIQELIKAENLLVLWGDEQIQWSVLATAFRTLHCILPDRRSSNSRSTPWGVVASSIAYQVWQQKEDITHPRTILENMEHYQLSECTDLHDKAYALTGISSDAELLQVDYELSLPDLYANLMALVVDKTETLGTSRLLLRALRNKHWDAFANSSSLSLLRGHTAECRARLVGQVTATTVIQPPFQPDTITAEIYEMMLGASFTGSVTEIDYVERWARQFCQKFRNVSTFSLNPITFVWLSNGRIGASEGDIIIGDSIFACSGIFDHQKEIYLRAEQETDLKSPSTAPSSPTLSSPTQSTSFSGLGTGKACRVWLSESSPSASPMSGEQAWCHLQIPLPELIALDASLDIEFRFQSNRDDETLSARRRASSQRQSLPQRERGFSDPISDLLDQTMASSPKGIWKSPTWPFIDAVARDLRDKLFISEDSPLNKPD